MPFHCSSSLSSSSIGFQRLIDRSHVELVEARHVLAQHLRTRGRRQFVRHFLKFLKENNIIAGNPAETVIRARKEEKDPTVLFKNEYKALLFEAQGNSRDYAILLTFLKSGIRESELAALEIDDIDFAHDELTVREGKGKKERKIPLMPELKRALKRYLADRDRQDNIVDEETLFLARNGTSLNPTATPIVDMSIGTP